SAAQPPSTDSPPPALHDALPISEMNCWGPDPENPRHIIRTSRTDDDIRGVSEFPHLIVNQARVLDYYLEAARRGPARIAPDNGRSEEHTSELQSRFDLVCSLLLE